MTISWLRGGKPVTRQLDKWPMRLVLARPRTRARTSYLLTKKRAV
jgi:hypothetical protein